MKRIALTAMAVISMWATPVFAQTNKASFFLNKDEQKEINGAVKNLTSSCQKNVFSQVYDDYLTISKTVAGEVTNLKVAGNDFVLEVSTSDNGIEKIVLTSNEDERSQDVTLVQGSPVICSGYLETNEVYSFTIGMLKSINATVENYFTGNTSVAKK